jgi:hypothetical protein
MADSPAMQAAQRKWQSAIEKQLQIHQQTNDPNQHAKAAQDVHDALTAMSDLTAAERKKTTTGTIAGSAPKSAWQMLTGQ